MLFTETHIPGVYTLDIEKRGDERGFFARTFCEKELELQGLETRFVQQNASFSAQKGTLRGLHFQRAPDAEVKLIRCVRGAILDLAIDLRPESATFRRWITLELTAENRRLAYIPRGFAHGFMTLTDDTEVSYLVSAFYKPEAEGGVRWNDPAFGLELPFEPTVVSPKDASWPDFSH
jgi:dTDP-4-dehydrorhamnose 3,5-epimerase